MPVEAQGYLFDNQTNDSVQGDKKVDVTLYISETETKVYTVKRLTSQEADSDSFGVAPARPLFDGYDFMFSPIWFAYLLAHHLQ